MAPPRSRVRRPSVSAETLALEATHEVIMNAEYAQLKFASHMHTVRHMRDEAWQAGAFFYGNLATWEKAGSVSVVERAAAKAREILASHRPEPLPASIADAVRRASC